MMGVWSRIEDWVRSSKRQKQESETDGLLGAGRKVKRHQLSRNARGGTMNK